MLAKCVTQDCALVHPLVCGEDLLMTLLSSSRKPRKESFISHINFIDEKIQFTMEESREDGSISFLDTLVTPCSDGSLSRKVYRKPTHKEFYLQWDSHHTIAAKCSVVSTLHHRAKVVCSTQQLLEEEENHLQKVLTENKYPNWALNGFQNRIKAPTKQDLKRREHTSNRKGQNKSYMILPYVRGLSESMKNICNNMGYRCITEEAIPSMTSWWLPKIKITSQWRVASSTGSNAKGWTVMMST